MPEFGDDLIAKFPDFVARFGLGVALTYAVGTNSKAIPAASWFRKALKRTPDPRGGLDLLTCDFVVLASEFDSGFSSSNPVVPGDQHTATVAGEAVWTVGPLAGLEAVHLVNEAVWVIRAAKRVQRGQK